MIIVVTSREKTGNWKLETRKTLYNCPPSKYLSLKKKKKKLCVILLILKKIKTSLKEIPYCQAFSKCSHTYDCNHEKKHKFVKIGVNLICSETGL